MMMRRPALMLVATTLVLGSGGTLIARDAIAVPRQSAQFGAQVAQGRGQQAGDRPGRPGHPPGRPDFAAAAEALGVSEADLLEALDVPAEPPAPGEPRPERPDLAAAAQELGVTEAELQEALRNSRPECGNRPQW
jgi:hypothetical protein